MDQAEAKHLFEPTGDFQCLHEFIPAARAKLSDHIWGYLGRCDGNRDLVAAEPPGHRFAGPPPAGLRRRIEGRPQHNACLAGRFGCQ